MSFVPALSLILCVSVNIIKSHIPIFYKVADKCTISPLIILPNVTLFKNQPLVMTEPFPLFQDNVTSYFILLILNFFSDYVKLLQIEDSI